MIELVHLGEFPSIGAVWLRYPLGGREGDYVTIGGVRHVWNKYRMCWGDVTELVKDARGKTIIDGDLDVYNDVSIGGFLRAKFGVQGGNIGAWVDEVKKALDDIRASRGRAGGVAPLDEYGTVPSRHLPSHAKFEQDLRRDLANSVSPTTLRVMRILQGDPSLQFVFIQSMVSAVRVDHVVSYDKDNRILKVPEGVIQHLTLGIDAVRPGRPLKDYRRWSVPALSWSIGGDETRTLYLYAKVVKEGNTGEFVVSDKAIGLESEAGYYMLLVGMLSAPPERVFSKLYGFSEYLPGLIRIERLESPDGEFVIDLVRKTIQGAEVTFKSGGSVDNRLNEILNESRGYTDRKKDEQKSYTDSKSEAGRRYADNKADAVRRDAERKAQEVSDEARGYTDGKLKEGKEYTDRKATDALERSKGYSDEADKKVRKRMDEQSSATLKGAKEYADGKDESVRRDAQAGSQKAKEDAIAEANKKDKAVIDQSSRALDKAKEDLRTYINDKVREVSDGMATYEYLRRSILEGDTKIYGGLVLSNILATRDVAKGGIRSFMAGTQTLPAFASGVSGFGTEQYRAITEIYHDGTGHIGTMYIIDGGRSVVFRQDFAGKDLLRIGGGQTPLSEMISNSSQQASSEIPYDAKTRRLLVDSEGNAEITEEIVHFDIYPRIDGSSLSIRIPIFATVLVEQAQGMLVNGYATISVIVENNGVVLDKTEYNMKHLVGYPHNHPTRGVNTTYQFNMNGIRKGSVTCRFSVHMWTERDSGSPQGGGLPANITFDLKSNKAVYNLVGLDANAREVVFGERGMSLFWGKNKFVYINGDSDDSDTFVAVRGNTDMPGVLLAGQVNVSNGGGVSFERIWGAYGKGCTIERVGNGTYRITHSIGHHGYIVVANSIGAGAQTASAGRITDTTFDITTKHHDDNWNIINFSFVVIGDNYKQ